MPTNVAIGSPFPWSPGHTVTETEYLIQKILLHEITSDISYPLLPGPVSSLFLEAYKGFLGSKRIQIVHNVNEIKDLIMSIDDDCFFNISLSHCISISNNSLIKNNTQIADRQDTSWNMLSEQRLKNLQGSTKLVHTLSNDFSRNFYRLRTSQPCLPRVNLNLIDSLIPEIKEFDKVALINIREHSANGSFSLSLKEFIPLISHLKSHNYLVIDISHEKKNCLAELIDLGVIPYWNINGINFLTDIDLCSKASFYIGAGGISHLCLAMGIPTLWVGSLFPLVCPSINGMNLPCSLYSRKNHIGPLPTDEAFREFYNLRNPWDKGFDPFTLKWGPGNPFNCHLEMSAKYIIYPPQPLDIVTAFEKLEYNYLSNALPRPYISSTKDLDGRPFVLMNQATI